MSTLPNDTHGDVLARKFEAMEPPAVSPSTLTMFQLLTAQPLPANPGWTDPAVYMLLAVRTLKPSVRASWKDSMLNAATGVASEAGEINEIIKKHFFHDHPMTQEVVDHLKKEIGDELWYLALLCYCMRFDMGEVMATNIKKLEARYPEGVLTTDRSLHRAPGDV